tara:strand:+ start:235 stop:516 length:282 start_codon:yes stop_codon:yes gene_type:complete
LSKQRLIKQLKQKHPYLSNSDLEDITHIFSKKILSSLKKGEKIELRGFGTFFIKKIKEKHSARNPKTGQLIYIPEKNKLRFKAGKKLKYLINQ